MSYGVSPTSYAAGFRYSACALCITVHPSGPGTKGQPVLVQPEASTPTRSTSTARAASSPTRNASLSMCPDSQLTRKLSSGLS
jgi:hypothetical protein